MKKKEKNVCVGLEMIKVETSIKNLLFSLRLGKHRKDERPGEKIERKASSKSKAEDAQVSEEETLLMRLEQER